MTEEGTRMRELPEIRAEYLSPREIEERSMEIISEELRRRGLQPAPENADVVRRVIHATADFDFLYNAV